MNAEVMAENNPVYGVSLDSFHILHGFFTHEDQRYVQVLVVLLDEVLIVPICLPLVFVLKPRTGGHRPTRDGREMRRQSTIQRFLDPKTS